MDWMTLMLYSVTVAVVTVTPGPTMLLALNNGARGGMRTAACGIAGAALSDLLLISAVGFGLGAVLQASELLFSIVKYVGAAYLLYLAWIFWRAPVQRVNASTAELQLPPSGRTAFIRSLLVALSNPKGLLFFSAFLPQFIQPTGGVFQQYATLAIVTALIDIALMTLYAFSGKQAMRALSGNALRWLNRGCAGLLAGLGVALGFYRRHD